MFRAQRQRRWFELIISCSERNSYLKTLTPNLFADFWASYFRESVEKQYLNCPKVKSATEPILWPLLIFLWVIQKLSLSKNSIHILTFLIIYLPPVHKKGILEWVKLGKKSLFWHRGYCSNNGACTVWIWTILTYRGRPCNQVHNTAHCKTCLWA